MDRQQVRFSRPVYESLPWVYLLLGAGALAASYFLQVTILSLLAGVIGFLGVIAGMTILLRRKDYREMRERYPHDAE